MRLIRLFLIFNFSVLVICFLVVYVFLNSEFQKLESDNPLVWESDIESFLKEDEKNGYLKDAVLFVGSSSIRFWTSLEKDLEPFPVIKRGFGGSKLDDIIYYTDKIIIPYQPKAIVFYAGTNDIAGYSNDKSAIQVAESFFRLAEIVTKALPDTVLYYLPITPTVSRWGIWPEANTANRLIREESQKHNNIHYLETTSHFLNENGEPRKELFFWDGVHLNSKGYEVWARIIKETLTRDLENEK